MQTDQRVRLILIAGSPALFGILTGLLNASKLFSTCRRLRKPPLTMPGPLSILLWLAAYIAIGLACYLISESHVYRDEKVAALLFCGGGILLHSFWVFFFSHTRLFIIGALIHLAYFAVVLLTTGLFLKNDKRAGMLSIPYAVLSLYYTYVTLALIFIH